MTFISDRAAYVLSRDRPVVLDVLVLRRAFDL